VTLEQLADSTIPIALVEGEKKALALWRLANYNSPTARFIPIAIAGVWNWRGNIGKTGGPNGERLDVKGPIPDLNRIEWTGRTVFIVFDTNVQTNDSVKWARLGISRELASRQAKTLFVNLPQDCGVNGVDDLLALRGPSRVLELFDAAADGDRLEVIQSPQYQTRPDGMFRVSRSGESLKRTQLTNYSAKIVANICLDDGLDTRREFEIAAELLNRKFQFTISAAEFASMDWSYARLGAAAITFPSQRDHARTAVQSLSMGATDRSIYTHTGWRQIDGRWVFLQVGGAIGGTGLRADVEVRFTGPLARYQMRSPESEEQLLKSVTASLNLAELGPPEIGFPLLAATYRAVWGGADFAVHVAGETGAFKSEIAALQQQHYGAEMDRRRLPGSWSSTMNALEALASCAKDVLLVIDDFAPQGNSADVARYHASADRVFRAAGNHSGRARLDSTARMREPRPPRSLILSTGEEVPRGQSIRARLLILELSKNMISAASLTVCQEDARLGLYSGAMSAFIAWIATDYEKRTAQFQKKVLDCRNKVRGSMAHARTPEILANLQASFEMFLEFGVQIGVIDYNDREALAQRCWNGLGVAAAHQAKQQTANEPAARFLAILRSLFTSENVHLDARVGGAPDDRPETCGWKKDHAHNWNSRGDRVGWLDSDDVYLDSAAAFRAVQIATREMGEPFPISEQTLRRRLNEKGFLVSTDPKRQTFTIRRRIAGHTKEVLHLLRTTLFAESSDGDEDAE
jgi:hypothetical protein